MQVDGDGRYCERCQLRVTNTAELDDDALASFGADPSQRSCGRFELEDGRPRTKLGLATGVLVVVLAGCATPGAVQPAEPAWSELVDASGDVQPDHDGVIAGVVRRESGEPIENALVILQSTALPEQREHLTTARGVYAFKDLPPGSYTIQVLSGRANVSKVTQLPAGAKFRANFKLNPNESILMGMVVCDGDRAAIDPTTASSTYHSSMVEIP